MDRTSLGARVRDARKARGLTQLQLANVVDCDPTTVSLIEGGKVDTSAKLIAAIAVALGVTTDSLLIEGTDAQTSSEVA